MKCWIAREITHSVDIPYVLPLETHSDCLSYVKLGVFVLFDPLDLDQEVQELSKSETYSDP